MDATHLCQQRTTGAQNWEAWIKDTRDNELYRIVYMPDNNWWLAQNVKYAGTGALFTINGCTPDKCGRSYTHAQARLGGGSGANVQGVCPSGWVMPIVSEFGQLWDAVSPDEAVICQRLRALNSRCGAGNDWYGWASIMQTHIGLFLYEIDYGTSWMPNDGGDLGAIVDQSCSDHVCNRVCIGFDDGLDRGAAIRCFRKL
jgi:uncharacterized protein (TIGR02145 family)